MSITFTLQNALRIATAAATLLVTIPASAYGPTGKPAASYINRGDRIVLNQDISTAAGSRIYIQNGKTKSRGDVYEADPYCYFSLYRSSAVIKSPFELGADSFAVRKTRKALELVQHNGELLQLAAGLSFSQDNSEQTLITRIRISSPNYPEVVGLHCGVWAVANERNHLSLDEIRDTLGNVVSLELAESP